MRFYYCLYAVAIAILAYSVGLQSIIALIGCLICCLVIFFIYVNLNQNTLPKHRDLITNGRPRFSVDCRLSTIRLPVRRHKAATDFLPDSKQSEKKATISSNNQQKDESFVEFLGQGNRIAPTALYKRPTRAPIIPPHPSYSVVDKTHTWQPKSVGQHHQQPTTSSFISYLQKNDSSDNASTTDRVIIDDITGDPLIDEQLGALLNLFFRDYILTWYRSISSEDNEFPKELYQLIKHSIRSLANQLSKIDKINYITTQLVDELASHLRLYRSALTKLHNELGTNYQSIGMLPSKTSRSGNPKESWNRQLYEYFFDYEYQMEKNVCRNHVCMNKDGFFDYINHICDILENLILPNDCLLNTPLRILCRSVLSNMVLDPFVTCFSEPDYLNQMIVWLCKSYSGSTDTFILLLRHCDDIDELKAVLEVVKNDIVSLRGKDTGRDDDLEIKQRLNSLMYVQALIDQRMISSANVNFIRDVGSDVTSGPKYKVLNRSASSDSCSTLDAQMDPYVPQLTLNSILMDNIALSYFIEYMSSIGAQNYAYFYLNVEGFKISVQHQIAEARHGSSRAANNLESLREAAFDIYRNYLDINGRANFKLNIKDQDMIERLRIKICNTAVSPTWFDGVQQSVFEIMRTETTYYKSFLRSQQYAQLLNDMGLVRAPSTVTISTSNAPDTWRRNTAQVRPNSALGLVSNNVLTSSGSYESSNNLATLSEACNEKVAAGLDVDSEDNIALRILLLLVDEVFNLKAKALWLRRQIVSFLRTVIHVTLGDKMNRKIIDYVEEMTSARACAAYIRAFRDSYWPNGKAAGKRETRDIDTQRRTRVAAKYLMMCSISDEFKRIIGNDTSREGMMLVFDMFQHEILNRRLILVLFESFLQQLFPSRHFREVFEHLHSRSLRSKKQPNICNNEKQISGLIGSSSATASRQRASRHRPTLSLSSAVSDWPRHWQRDSTPI